MTTERAVASPALETPAEREVEAPSARAKAGRAAAIYLYETLNRIELPAWDEIPGADQADHVSRPQAGALGRSPHGDHSRPRGGRIVPP